MWRVVFIVFLIAHGAVHLAMWAMPAPPDAPFDAAHSWLLGTQRGLALAWAIAAAALLVGAGADCGHMPSGGARSPWPAWRSRSG